MSANERFSDELYVEVLSHATPSTAATMALAARRFPTIVAPVLYRHVVLGFAAAALFFHTLRLKPELGSLVISLHFLATTSEGRHEGEDFDAAISSLTEVETLHIMCPIDVETLLTRFAAFLTTFTYGVPICDTLYPFLLQQHWISSLSLYHPLVHPRFNNAALPSWFLGHLVQVEAPIDNICDLIVGAPVRRLKIRYSELELQHRPYLPMTFIGLSASKFTHLEVLATQLLNATRDDFRLHLPALRVLVVVADVSWGSARGASAQFLPLVTDLAKALTALRALERLVVLTQFGGRQARTFCQALRNHCRAPLLRRFWFHGMSSCYYWRKLFDLESTPYVKPLGRLFGYPEPSPFADFRASSRCCLKSANLFFSAACLAKPASRNAIK
ncbi:hypothetical protein C8F04DRAFT_1270211 [Mycena alexandri]|uniref:Uncharacterized protein n=1 Tax=Mycena alexandri TaxID=1745969 RepID=A0AAD6SCL6_9AGAR|nr:hypothetical protein C8F04DRAFT_1270211 [Mycena alexandri]